mgnify:CR=1 FL=1
MTSILVVDEEPTSRARVARLLRDQGLEVFEAGVAGESLQVTRDQHPDLVLIAVNPLDMSGSEAARRIRAEPELADIFVIMSSRRTWPVDQADDFGTVADGFISRPIANREMAAQVRTFLRLRLTTDALLRSEARLRLRDDATASREAARRLRASEQRQRSLFEQKPDSGYSLDLDGHVVASNVRFEQLTGYSIDEALGMHFVAMVAPECELNALAHFDRALAGESARYETVCIRNGGGRIDVDVATLPILVDGVASGVYDLIKNVSERKAAAEELRRSQALVMLAGAVAEVGGWSVDLSDRRVTWSDVVAAIHEIPPGFSPLGRGSTTMRPSTRECSMRRTSAASRWARRSTSSCRS